MDDSFLILTADGKLQQKREIKTENLPDITNLANHLARTECIAQICNGKNKNYKTEYPHIVKFCRICITNVCRELHEIINWEARRFKEYGKLLSQIEAGEFNQPVRDINELQLDLKVNILDSRHCYSEAKQLLQDLQKKKLYTKGCIVCEAVKEKVS